VMSGAHGAEVLTRGRANPQEATFRVETIPRRRVLSGRIADWRAEAQSAAQNGRYAMIQHAINKRWRTGIAALALVCAAGCTSPGESTARVSQQDSCINPTRIQQQKILSDQEIQFTLTGGEVWLNRLPRACPGLKSQGGFNWEVRGTTVCSNEQTIYVLEDRTPCQLGVFTRVATGS
jgi:hypothetical protein